MVLDLLPSARSDEYNVTCHKEMLYSVLERILRCMIISTNINPISIQYQSKTDNLHCQEIQLSFVRDSFPDISFDLDGAQYGVVSLADKVLHISEFKMPCS